KGKLPERIHPKKEKRSQMGNFGPNSPSSAVSSNTPTVQATSPTSVPTVPSASSTVTKIGQVIYAAWADELEKIARAKWRIIAEKGGELLKRLERAGLKTEE